MLHGARIASDESAFDFARPSQTAIGEPGGDGLITVPDAHLLFNGDFQRHGSDLKIVGEEGKSFLVPDYFKGEKNPTLLSPEGAALTGDIVEALAGPRAPGQYAQAGQQQTSDQPAIGRVEQVSGNATIVRNGVAITANQGDVVRKGDVVQTGDGQIAVLFSDGSTFSLSANARMVLNDFVYQAGGSNNSALISLVQGTIGFVAGQVAKTGDMRVDTPVATMGIRGTAVLIEITANNGQTKFSVLVEPDGTTGSFNLYDKSSGALLGTVNNSTVGWVVTPAGPLQVIAQQVQKSPGEVQQELNYFQQIFNIFNQGQQNPFVPEQRTDNPNPQNTNGQGTQITTNLQNGQPTNPNGGNQPETITVTVTPLGNGNNGNNGPFNGNSPLPDVFVETGTFNIIHGSGVINGTPIRDIIFGSMGVDIIHGDDGPDDVFALGGDDIIIAGHGGGNDFYDGGDGFDTIAFPSANQDILFHLNLEVRDGKLVSTAFNPGETGADVFVDMEKVVGGSGNDVFVLHDDFEWELNGGDGVDTLQLAGNLSFRDYDPDGPEITNFEIIDLNDGAGAAFANEVDFDFHGTNEMFADNYVRVIGGTNDKINLIDESYEYPGGHWVLLQTFEPPVFGDSLTSTVTFNAWAYVSGETTLFTIYVDQDVSVNVIENVEVVVHTNDGYDLTDSYDDLANFEEMEINVEAGTIAGDANGKRIVFSVENIVRDGANFDLTGARITEISIYEYIDSELVELSVTLDGFDIPVLQLDAAIAAYVASNDPENPDTALLDAIFGNVTYTVTGNEGDDVLTGGNYRDVIDGGEGNDELTGGLNADTFVYNGGDDTITDFSIESGDRIDLSAFNQFQSMQDIGPLASYDEESGDTIIDFGNGNTLTLENVVLNDLSDNDFIFNSPPQVTFAAPDNVIEAGEEPGTDVSSTILNVSDVNGDKVTFDATGWSAPQGAVEFNGHYYKFISSYYTSWTDAQQAALNMGGYLANITSAAENSFIFGNVTQGSFAWIGATDQGTEGNWVWADGAEAGFLFWQGDGDGSGNGYAAWWGQEPNGGTSENYAFIDHNGVWTDVSNTGYTAGYVVEFSAFTKTGVYGSASYNADTGQLTYTLDNNDADTQALGAGQTVTDSFELTFVDENGAETTKTVNFTVEGSNDAPVADAYYFDDQNATTGESFTYTLTNKTFSDIDSGDTLTYSAKLLVDGEIETALPVWLSFDPLTRTFSGTPPAGEAGDYEIRVIAKDAAGATAFESFTLSVDEGEGGNTPGTVTVTIHSDEGLFTPSVYLDLLYGDVLPTSLNGSYINLHVHNVPGTEWESYERFYRVLGEDLTFTTEGEDTFLTGGTITGIELYSDASFQHRMAEATGYDISATVLQDAIDQFDAGNGEDYFSLFEPYAYVMNGGDGADVLVGGSQNDTINGSDSTDMLAGLEGEDTLDGGAGADFIYGDAGNDTLTGGADNDMFMFDLESNNSVGHDTVTDFVQGVDKIVVFSFEYAQIADLSIAQDGNDTVITFATEAVGDFEDSIRLQNFTGTLASNDFIFGSA